MLCEKCGQNEATVKFVKIENNNKTELRLCQGCAQGYTNFSLGFDLQNILSSMFQHGPFASKSGPVQEGKSCPTCGLTLLDVQKSGRLGCSSCYEVFSDELNPVLRRLHGSTKHTGKVPVRSFPKAWVGRQIEEVRRQLDECVRTENFEQAAIYRDEIRQLEQKLAREEESHEGD